MHFAQKFLLSFCRACPARRPRSAQPLAAQAVLTMFASFDKLASGLLILGAVVMRGPHI
ncbi:hypothetical protein HMPREF0372_03625 [Flavonifractor plautii ATCC 29863]|uniref:Uncharacterized protein n=1 Tax=Flavonifractor plautii ATCC 29863 TaxID=411475 RepID=G9YVR0_FLAPL|nr:hypothetical protein HMPREF0372_03625 [Flavonifractor plautii ATCC 29863]